MKEAIIKDTKRNSVFSSFLDDVINKTDQPAYVTYKNKLTKDEDWKIGQETLWNALDKKLVIDGEDWVLENAHETLWDVLDKNLAKEKDELPE